MTFECPLCGHALVKAGSWFQVVSKFKCEGCHGEILLTYPDKLALFEKHAYLA